jgi:hypothetical protein
MNAPLHAAICAQLTHAPGALQDPLTEALCDQADTAAHTPQGKWADEPIETPMPWFAVAIALAIGFGLGPLWLDRHRPAHLYATPAQSPAPAASAQTLTVERFNTHQEVRHHVP